VVLNKEIVAAGVTLLWIRCKKRWEWQIGHS